MPDLKPPYSASKGRRFAFTLGAAFVVFALFAFWRERETVGQILAAIAALLLTAGGLAPSRLGPLERGWMAIAHAISRVTTPVFMGIVYYLVLSPVGAVRRLAGSNPLIRRPANGSYWVPRSRLDGAARRKRMERQF